MKYIESETRPWGSFFVIHDEHNYKLKRIEVQPGQRLSYQYHKKRSEVWTIVDGKAVVTLDGEIKTLNSGETILIPQGMKHRVENQNDESLIQWGISEVRSIATNQTVLKSKALKTPGPNPRCLIVVGINKGKAIAPTRGVKATIKRTIN